MSLLNKDGNIGHGCMNCGQPMHGALCGSNWMERAPDCKFGEDDLSHLGKTKKTSLGAVICAKCLRG